MGSQSLSSFAEVLLEKDYYFFFLTTLWLTEFLQILFYILESSSTLVG